MTGVELRAGASAVALPVPLGTPMMGYGARRGVAQARHDPLQARALYLESGAARLLWIQCDLCLMSPAQAADLRERVAQHVGQELRDPVRRLPFADCRLDSHGRRKTDQHYRTDCSDPHPDPVSPYELPRPVDRARRTGQHRLMFQVPLDVRRKLGR